MLTLNGSSPRIAQVVSGVLLVAMFGAAVYRRYRLKRQGFDPIPPLFQSVVADVIFWSVALGIYGFLFGSLFLVDPPIVRRMTGFFVLMGAFSAIRQRRWPKGSAWYDLAAAASAVILSIPLGLIIERVF